MITAAVSGSFHRHLDAVYEAVNELKVLGVDVLSPRDPRVVDARGDFLFVASDQVRSVRLVQDRHLESIKGSDFLWLVSPDGYVGQSASMELGYAVASGIPIFGMDLPYDLTLRQYVRRVPSLTDGVRMAQAIQRDTARPRHFLIDPYHALDEAQQHLEVLWRTLRRGPQNVTDREGAELLTTCGDLCRIFGETARD